MDFIFATNNPGKLREIRQLTPDNIKIHTLKEVGITEDIPEPFFTFKENALAKAKYVYDKTQKACWAEDSGLIVPSLNGDPGVHSARYSGFPKDDHRNNEKLLKELADKEDRKAYYEATLCLIMNRDIHYFVGQCHGQIIKEYRGSHGFGYDPLFIPDGYDQTFGELNSEIKNKISHRAKAFAQLAEFLNQL